MEYDNYLQQQKDTVWYGFYQTVSALMNATPGRDLCWL